MDKQNALEVWFLNQLIVIPMDSDVKLWLLQGE